MATFDLLVRGGLLVDGTGAPGRPADVGVRGDRIAAVGNLGAVEGTTAARVIDASGLTVCPGFVDPHGHSDASLFVDGALVSHLRQGFTTQLSGNCGATVAPITPIGRELVEIELRLNRLTPRWTTFADYLDAVSGERLGLNVAFLAGHGTLRGSVLGSDARDPSPDELGAMVSHLEAAIEAGAFGLSSGLIYAPGIHAHSAEIKRLVAVAASRGGLYATHMRNEADGLFAALDEALDTIRAAGEGARLQVSHLKAGARAVWGRAGEAVERLRVARDREVDVGADQYPYTAAATTLQIVLPPELLALGIDECVAVLADHHVRDRVRSEIEAGMSGWENVGNDPGWSGIRISFSESHPDWAGRTIEAIAEDARVAPADIAFDALVDDRLETSIVVECMDEADVRTILAVPWIAVCTDAEGRRPKHPILDAGVPHPRTYGSTARVLGAYVRDEGLLPLAAAVAKLTSVPAARIGLRDRGVVREGAFADIVVFDPSRVADLATYASPAVHPAGIPHVIVNGTPAVLDGRETGERPGRLLRKAG
ncbi:MAG: D-aminoacylase [Chloroflexi bacterium]|nr:MAG: D-aminoacylase [Chloroflexota bacterium]